MWFGVSRCDADMGILICADGHHGHLAQGALACNNCRSGNRPAVHLNSVASFDFLGFPDNFGAYGRLPFPLSALGNNARAKRLVGVDFARKGELLPITGNLKLTKPVLRLVVVVIHQRHLRGDLHPGEVDDDGFPRPCLAERPAGIGHAGYPRVMSCRLLCRQDDARRRWFTRHFLPPLVRLVLPAVAAASRPMPLAAIQAPSGASPRALPRPAADLALPPNPCPAGRTR